MLKRVIMGSTNCNQFPFTMYAKALLLLSIFLGATAAISGGRDPGASRSEKSLGNSNPSDVVTTPEINKLIRQLASNDFKSREAANQTLNSMGYPALEALRRAALNDQDPEVRQRSAALVQQIENRFDALAADYRAFGLPFPPRGAKLLRYGYPEMITVNGQREPKVYGLVFMAKPSSENEPPIVLADTDQFQLWPSEKITVIDLEPRYSKGNKTSLLADSRYREISALLCTDRLYFFEGGLAFAIQCRAQGWNDVAQAVFDHYDKAITKYSTPRRELIRMAQFYWEQQLLEPGTDWKRIAKQLHGFIAIDKSLDSPVHRAMLRSLDAALAPSNNKPGSIAAMIDDLTNCRSTDLAYGENDSNPRDWESALGGRKFDAEQHPDTRYLKVVLRGFDAVPQLIDHLDDDRLTRMYLMGFNNFPGYQCRIGHIVSDLLQGLADEELGRDWLRRLQGYKVEKARARAWWEKVKRQGEENYVVGHVLDKRADDWLPTVQFLERIFRNAGESRWPNPQILRIIFEKYPQRLPEMYRFLIDKIPQATGWPLAHALSHAALPREKKVELLAYGSRLQDLKCRAPALWQLKELDTERYIKTLINTLNGLPASPVSPCWECPEALFAVFVRETDDPRVWQALLKAAKRANVGLRMEYLGQVTGASGTPDQRWRRARFLAEFLDDATVRNVEGRLYEVGYQEHVGVRAIEVRNYAAIAIGRLLKLNRPLPGDGGVFGASGWKPDQWSQLRQQVREALKSQTSAP